MPGREQTVRDDRWPTRNSKGDSGSPSLVLINTGHGKGKSSSAFGVMGRAWARGWTVGVVQFVKGGKWKVGERKLADHLGIEWQVAGRRVHLGVAPTSTRPRPRAATPGRWPRPSWPRVTTTC